MSESNAGVLVTLKHKAVALLDWLRTTSDTAKYLIFFLSLQYLFASSYFWSEAQLGQNVIRDESGFWEFLAGYSEFILTLLTGIFAVSRKKRVALVAVVAAGIALATTMASDLMQTRQMYAASDIAMIVFFVFTAAVILHNIWTTRGVTLDTIIGAVCVYILIVATWAFAYTLMELHAPGSFLINAEGKAGDQALLSHRNYPLFMYYSFITQSSVGYGDIIPASPGARMLAAWQGIAGQFYMAILVARLVALHIAHATTRAVKADQP